MVDIVEFLPGCCGVLLVVLDDVVNGVVEVVLVVVVDAVVPTAVT